MKSDSSKRIEEEEEDGIESFTISTLLIGFQLPFQFTIKIPGSNNYIQLGTDSLKRLRKRVLRNPNNASAHITLAASLLSQEPQFPSQLEEAVQALRVALELLPAIDQRSDVDVQEHAMVHKFLGDALIALGQRTEARKHWLLAVVLDPVRPPWGFSGPAQEMLDKYPAV